ncbi:MAG: 4a-hydroxytetrahydrobiopterin dehydratase [Parcubacteria group bacterium]|nr:4a-hydroxytetrahydrobiopterin dehydratase [Parcubacteria group bacterium]
MDLLSKKCVPCEGGVPPLTASEIEKYLPEVPGWQVSPTGEMIWRNWKFKKFSQALAFVNKVGGLAESEGHHPDIQLYNWNRVRLELCTHAIGGLSENDFILAAKINALTLP